VNSVDLECPRGTAELAFSYVTALHARVPLTLHEPSPTVLSSALKRLDGLLSRDVEKGRISKDEADAARGRVRGVEGDAAKGQGLETDVDLVIEVGRTSWLVGGRWC
jgi:3-hydroxybutyryl-CoA dehydrogenase